MFTQPWREAAPTPTYLLGNLFTLAAASVVAAIFFRTHDRRKLVRWCGVTARKVTRSINEIDRKVFHLCGLLVPITHQLLLTNGYSSAFCHRLCWSITVVGWAADVARLKVPLIRRYWPMASILREHEQNQLTGGCYFSLGCTLAITLSPPSIAMASILNLVLGDMSAAIIGVSFGGEACSVKLGRSGKKSLEGSVAMFAVCFVVGCSVFAGVELREYPVFFGALVATLTELYEPAQLNDNLTIPIFSSLAMQWGFSRIASCSTPPTGLEWLLR